MTIYKLEVKKIKKKKIGIQFRKMTSLPGYPEISLIIFVSFKLPWGP